MRIDSPPSSGYPGIVLRQLQERDLAAWSAYLSIPEVVEHTSWRATSSHDLIGLLHEYEALTTTSSRRLVIVDRQSGALTGTIGFHSVSPESRSAEITYDLAPVFWGRGIATAVCNAITEWFFSEYGFVRVQATVLETNLRSARRARP